MPEMIENSTSNAPRSAPQAAASQTPRGIKTREKLIRVAVRLFAERGIEGVSLNDINKAAGQRNKNATHYHFGSKEGLLQAIIDKHEPPIAAHRNQLLDRFEANGELSLRQVIRAVVEPLAEKLNDPDGGADFVRFSAHLVTTHAMAAMNMSNGYRIDSVQRVAHALEERLGHLPKAIMMHRGILLGIFITHAVAEHSRLSADVPAAADRRLFIANLEDCLLEVLNAPVDPVTAALIPSGDTPQSTAGLIGKLSD